MIDTGLRGRSAIVTGTDNPQGIGQATARALADLGVRLFLVYQEHEPVDVLREIGGGGRKAMAMRTDLSDPAAPAAIFEAAEAALGPIAMLVNNAAASDTDTF